MFAYIVQDIIHKLVAEEVFHCTIRKGNEEKNRGRVDTYK